MVMKKRYILLTGAILIVAIGFLYTYSIGFSQSKKIEKKSTNFVKAKANMVFTNRENLRYSLTNNTIVIPTNTNKFFKKIDIDIDSELEVIVFKENSEIYLGMQFKSFLITLHQQGQESKQKAQKVMFEPFLATLDDGAKISDILLSKKLDSQQMQQIKGLIQTLQIAFRADTSTWKDSEENKNGLYENRYNVTVDKAQTYIEKVNTRYSVLASAEASIEIKKSQILATADNKSWLKELNLLQEELYGARGKAMMNARIKTNLKRLSNTNSMTLHRYKNADALRRYLHGDIDKKKVLDNNKTKSVQKIESFFACMKDGTCNFLDIARTLKAYLVAHPDDYYLVLNLIKDSHYKEFHHRIINMLRELGTPEAQEAILAIIQSDEFTKSNRTQAAMTIGFLSEPTSDTIALMKELVTSPLLDQQQQTALYYALGNIASLSQEAYDKIAPDIIQNLQSSTSAQDTILALSALENTENNDIIQYVTPYLDDGNSAIRRGAVEALRLTPSPKATEALYNHLQKEEYDLVINAIAFSLHNKKDLSPDIVKEVAIKSANKIKKSNDTMMVKSVDFLVSKSNSNPDAKNALKQMMGKNLSVQVKQKIIRGL